MEKNKNVLYNNFKHGLILGIINLLKICADIKIHAKIHEIIKKFDMFIVIIYKNFIEFNNK